MFEMETIHRIPMTKKQTLTSKIKRTIFKDPQSGVEAMFIQLTKTRGIKIFPNKREADISFNLQKLAYKKGIAPKVFSSKIEKCHTGNFRKYSMDIFTNKDGTAFVDDEKPIRYGYFYYTEVAECPCRPYALSAEEYTRQKVRLLKIAPTVSYKGMKLGEDMHHKNLGTLRGKMVLIDFGLYSTT